MNLKNLVEICQNRNCFTRVLPKDNSLVLIFQAIIIQLKAFALLKAQNISNLFKSYI